MKKWLSKQTKLRRRIPIPFLSERLLPYIITLAAWLRRLTIASACIAVVVLGCLFYIKSMDLPASSVSQNSQMLDAQGNLIDYFHTGVNRRAVALKDVSPHVIHATLSIEDKRFYQHLGFDVKGMSRAVVVNLQSMSTKQGASTLTQQLARNLYLSHEKTLERKLKEAFYTVQLEMKYSKDEILQMYLNQIYYGHGAYGIEAAAQLYFKKSAADLTLAESTLLAGIPKGPTYYSPFNNMKNAKDRQKLILQAMEEGGFITEEEKTAAYEELLEFTKPTPSESKSSAPYFRDYVIQTAIEDLGIPEDLLYEGGITIYTTLDLQMQVKAEDAVKNGIPVSSEQQAALLAIDPRNGYIKAMVGGKDYQQNQFNRVLATTRQPGSTFKPFVYLTALKNHTLTITSKYKSEPTVFTYDEGRKQYEPQNYGDKYIMDYIDMRKAIASSDNIYAVNSILDAGADQVIETAKQLGISAEMEPVPSLALGTFPISPLEMASAYSVFASGGVYNKPVAILKIVDAHGNTIYNYQPEPSTVISEAEAFLMTNLMEEVFETGGTAHRIQHMINRPIAGKSGTTAADAWMIGFTPELSTAVWVGYDKDRLITVAEAHQAAPIFAKFMSNALEAVPPKMFAVPEEGIVSVLYNEETGLLSSHTCPTFRVEYFLTDTEPTEYCQSESLEEQPQAPLTTPSETLKETPSYKKWWGQVKDWWTR